MEDLWKERKHKRISVKTAILSCFQRIHLLLRKTEAKHWSNDFLQSLIHLTHNYSAEQKEATQMSIFVNDILAQREGKSTNVMFVLIAHKNPEGPTTWSSAAVTQLGWFDVSRMERKTWELQVKNSRSTERQQREGGGEVWSPQREKNRGDEKSLKEKKSTKAHTENGVDEPCSCCWEGWTKTEGGEVRRRGAERGGNNSWEVSRDRDQEEVKSAQLALWVKATEGGLLEERTKYQTWITLL